MSVKLNTLKKQYLVTLKTITPVHVGNGEEYINGLDFVDNDFFDINRLMREVSGDIKLSNELAIEIEKGGLKQFRQRNRDLFRKISSQKTFPQSLSNQNIKKHIKTNGRIYLPGSSIKGSIRTSIATHYAFSENEQERENALNYRYNPRYLNSADQNLMKSIFGRDPKENLMRLLTVTDAECKNHSTIYEMQVLNSVRMKNKKIYYEMIPENSELSCTITLDQFLSEEDHRQKAKIPKKAFSFETIVGMLLEDAGEQINSNIDFDSDIIVRFYNNLGEIYNSLAENEAIFNIGAGIGWIGTTGNLIGEEMNKSIRQNLRLASDRNHIDLEFPKTRRVVDVGGKLVPPGWVKMTLKEIP